MSHLCKADKKELARDAEKVAERQKDGKAVYQCAKCKRMSHKEDHLCDPIAVTVMPQESATV